MYSACLKIERVLSPGIASRLRGWQEHVCDRAGILLRGDGGTGSDPWTSACQPLCPRCRPSTLAPRRAGTAPWRQSTSCDLVLLLLAGGDALHHALLAGAAFGSCARGSFFFFHVSLLVSTNPKKCDATIGEPVDDIRLLVIVSTETYNTVLH
jgi:hypothetical protein